MSCNSRKGEFGCLYRQFLWLRGCKCPHWWSPLLCAAPLGGLALLLLLDISMQENLLVQKKRFFCTSVLSLSWQFRSGLTFWPAHRRTCRGNSPESPCSQCSLPCCSMWPDAGQWRFPVAQNPCEMRDRNNYWFSSSKWTVFVLWSCPLVFLR